MKLTFNSYTMSSQINGLLAKETGHSVSAVMPRLAAYYSMQSDGFLFYL